MRPTTSNVHTDQILGNMTVAYLMSDTYFIWREIFPPLTVSKQSDNYYIFDQKHWFVDGMQVRAPGDGFPESGYKLSTDSYTCLQYALAHVIPDETFSNADAPLDLRAAAARYLAQQANIRLERALATDFFATSVWTTDVTGGTTVTRWSDYSSGDPVGDLRTYRRTVNQLIGQPATRFACGEIVWDKLSNHPDLIDRLKYTSVPTDTSVDQAMAAVFGLETMLVGRAIYNTANEGQTASYSPILDDDALLYVYNPPGLLSLNAGVTFWWSEEGGMGEFDTWYDDEHLATQYRARINFDQKAIAAGGGVFFSDIVN